MDKKESRKAQDIKNPTFDTKKSNNKKDKSLPWWVELLFVQIGLPDKWLMKILKTKKNSLELLKNEQRFIFILLLVFSSLAYFYPVIKNYKTKLECQSIVKNYIKQNKNLSKINNEQLIMLSTNYCNGGNDIYEINNSND